MDATFEFAGKTVDYATLAETESLTRLIQLGFSTALKNSHAGLEAKLRKEQPNITEEEVKAAIEAKIDEKFRAIVAGKWNVRESGGGSALTARDKLIREIGVEQVTAWLVAKGRTWRAGKGLSDEAKAEHNATREKIYEAFSAKYGAQWAAEADRRLKAAVVEGDDIDLDDLI